jgi:hypothetical protein
MRAAVTKLKKFIAFLVIINLLITMVPWQNTAYAASPVYQGLTVGSNATLSSDGYKLSSAGLIDISETIFEVGISRSPKTKVTGTKAKTNIVENYQTVMPVNANNTLYFMTSTLYNQIKSRWGKFVVSWYSAGTKTMECRGDVSALYRVKVLKDYTSTYKPAVAQDGKYYSTLKSKYDPNSIASLGNGQWKNLLDGDGTKGLELWSYILQQTSKGDPADWDIERRMNEYTRTLGWDLDKYTEWPDSLKWEVKLRYLDLMMMTYEMIPAEATIAKSDWAAAIDDYITGVGLDSKPVTIVITPDVAINPGDPLNDSTGAIIVRTPDFLNYAAGVEAMFFSNTEIFVNLLGSGEDAVALTGSVTPSDTTRTYNNYTLAVKKSIAMSPNFKRITDALDPSNAFSWGYSAMAKYRLSTSGGTVRWLTTTVAASYLDILQIQYPNQTTNIKKTISGFLLVPAPPLGALSLKITLNATPDNKVIDSTTLGTVIKLDVKCKADPVVLSAWQPYIDAARAQGKTFNVKLSITRSYNQGSATANYSPTDIISTGRTLSVDQFVELLNGNTGIEVMDDVSTYPSNPPSKHIFDYTVTMTATLNNGQSPPPSGSGTASDSASIIVEDPKLYMKYTSSPDAYAELKEGKPYNESFDAMSGVPTTETLYLGAGGSEFIVQIKLKYHTDGQATRTYKVHYDGGVPCEFMDGDTAKFPNGQTHSSYEERDFVSGSRSGCGNYATPPPPKPKTYSWTAASDGITRTVTEHYQLIPNTWTDHYYETRTDSEGNTYQVHVPSKCTSHWEYYYKYWVNEHEICGPCCQHVLPDVYDTWKQTITFDYLEIVDVHVWKIDQASINGMEEIVGNNTNSTDILAQNGDVTVKAKIVKGDPNIFYNIAALTNPSNPNTSSGGRLRYSVEPQQHDDVVYKMGPRTNKCDGEGATAAGNVRPNGGQGHVHPWATGIIYDNRGFPNEMDYHRQKTSTKTDYSNIADAKDTQTTEWKQFDTFRKTLNTATVVSDMLILQTSSGDQSVIYFEKKSNTVRCDQNFDKVTATKEDMWDNNPLSAAKWTDKQINIGSYNGKWDQPTQKYEGTGNKAQIHTVFDSAPGEKDPASVSTTYKAAYKYLTRPARPAQLFLYKDGVKQNIDNANKSYITGEAEVFWKNILNYPSADTAIYDTSYKALYGANGYVQKAPYSPNHGKVNDIVVHDPVSTEDAVVVGLEASRDQRSTLPAGSADDTINEANRLKVCPRDPALCEFRVLNCTYFKDVLLAYFDFENGAVNQVTGQTYTLPSGFTIENVNRFGTGKSLSAKGVRWSIPFADLYNSAAGLTKGLQYNPGLPIYVEADYYIPVPSGTGTMLASFYRYDMYLPAGSVNPTWNTGHGWERRANTDITNKNLKIGMQFDMSNLDRSKLFINGTEFTNYTRINNSDLITADLVGDKINIGSWNVSDRYPANFYLDNLKIIRKAGTTNHNETCYKSFMFHPDGLNAHVHTASCVNSKSADIIASLLQGKVVDGSTGKQDFGYTGTVQSFTAPATGTYTLEVWGAEGGKGYAGAPGGKGGYAKGAVQLQKGQTVYIYVGGKPTEVYGDSGNAGGWNGGGKGSSYYGSGAFGGGGGGATDIRTQRAASDTDWSSTLNSRIIVAGGGGGGGHYGKSNYIGGYGGGTSGGSAGGSGATQTSGYALGQGQSSNYSGHDLGAGGGGYYGGYASTTRDAGGGGGSGYIGGVQNGQLIAGNASMPAPGGGTETGHSGNGYARITWDIPGVQAVDWDAIKTLLGPAFNAVFNPQVLYNMTFGDGSLKGFRALYNCTLSVSGGQMIFNITGSDPQSELPVNNIEAPAVQQIRITFDNNTGGTVGQLFYKGATGSYTEANSVKWSMTANKAGQVVTLDMTKATGWTGDIKSLRFDFSDASSGQVKITKIEFIGFGSASGGTGMSGTWTFGYTGARQTWSAPGTGRYLLEVWGAEGGADNAAGGKGGYAKGEINLTSGQTLYIFVGGKGSDSGGHNGGWNGGGYAYGRGGGGGGMTFISTSSAATAAPSNQAVNGGSWNDSGVIIVAGGGGGAGGSSGGYGGYGGGTTGGTGGDGYGSPGTGGTQTSGGAGGSNYGTSGGHGYGGSNTAGSSSGGGGGGGGWYGGGGGGNDYTRYNDNDDSGGGGGSSYIGGVQNGQIIAGNASMPAPGGGTETGHSGNGYAKITGLFSALTITYTPPFNSGSSGSQIFNYTGSYQTFTAPVSGTYTFEVWGAQGGGNTDPSQGSRGGKGGYSRGEYYLNAGQTIYIYVGGQGREGYLSPSGGWNGGGNGSGTSSCYGYGGGGATDIRVGGQALSNRVIVAGGGGGADDTGTAAGTPGGTNDGSGGYGGGLTGGNALKDGVEAAGTGATQTSGYALGQGQASGTTSDSGGGGGGYYGGYATSFYNGGGGGGSGYIGGVQNGITIPGNQTMPSPSGGTEVGHSGNGCAKITWCPIDKTAILNALQANYALLPEMINGALVTEWVDITNWNDPTPGSTPGSKYANSASEFSQIFSYSNGAVYRGVSIITSAIAWHSAGKFPYEKPYYLPDSHYGWRAYGEIYIPSDGMYTFGIDSDDAGDILIDGNVVVSWYGAHGVAGSGGTPSFTHYASVNLTAGWHKFEARMQEWEGEDGIAVGWKKPGDTAFSIIPASQFRVYNPVFTCGGLPLNTHICNANCHEESVLMCSEPHHNGLHYDGSNDICWDACNNDANHAFYKPKVFTPGGQEIPNGKFINIDWPFRVYFPNIGDFYQGGRLGWSSLTTTRGKGFVDNMDTTKWTRAKRIKFGFNVIFTNPITGEKTLYRAGEWIDLPVATQIDRIEYDVDGNPVTIYKQGTGISYYDFYCVLANREAKSALIEYEVEAINCPGENDNKINETNRKRYSDFTALHGGYRTSYIDVVGRIGNFVIADTDDYRFSNFFKTPVSSDKWIVEGIVKEVYPDVPNLYIGWKKDIRGVDVSSATHWFDTYGTQKWLDKAPVQFPLSPDKNNIPILRNQTMRPGYDILASIATIGNYQRGKLQVVPYYYALNLTSNTIVPVDAYMNANGKYVPINIYDLVKPGWDSSQVYQYVLNLDWVEEAPRRNYDMNEKAHTDALAQIYEELVMTPNASGELEVTGRRELDRPVGKYYNLGTAQLLTPNGKARTFIGSEYTYGQLMNLEGKIPASDWWYAGQRWHLKFGVPSSTVFVEHGKPVTPAEIAKIANSDTVILLSVDIQSIGDTYVLRYTQEGDNGSITINGKTYVMPGTIPPVVAVYSANRTSAQDVDIRGTH